MHSSDHLPFGGDRVDDPTCIVGSPVALHTGPASPRVDCYEAAVCGEVVGGGDVSVSGPIGGFGGRGCVRCRHSQFGQSPLLCRGGNHLFESGVVGQSHLLFHRHTPGIQFRAGDEGRLPSEERGSAGERAQPVGSRAAITQDDTDRFEVKSQRIGDDQAHRVDGATTQLDLARPDDDAAIRHRGQDHVVEVHAGRVGAAADGVDAGGHAVAGPEAALHQRIGSCPAVVFLCQPVGCHLLTDLVEAEVETATADLPPVNRLVTRPAGVPPPHLNRIDSESTGQLVDQLFLCERRLWVPEAAEALGWDCVRVHQFRCCRNSVVAVEVVGTDCGRERHGWPVT